MLTFVVLSVFIVALSGLFIVLFRGIDLAELRSHPQGVVSVEGLSIVMGLGFLIGLGYGLLLGSRAGGSPWIWVGRGLIDGLVMACAGTFYVGIIQRRQRRVRGDDGAPRD